MFLILDTDPLTLLERRTQPECDRLEARIEEHVGDEACTTVINFQERVEGWTAALKKANTPAGVVTTYARLSAVLREFCPLTVLPFTPEAQARFDEFRRQRIRIGTLDLRIASIAVTTHSILVSRNLRDFRKVPGLVVEDWTQ